MNAWIKKNIDQLLAAVLVVGLLAAVLISIEPVRTMAEAPATQWLADLNRGSSNDSEIPMRADLAFGTPEHLRLLQQLHTVKRRVEFHGNVMVFFYSRYFLALTMTSVAAVLAGAVLITITRVGWQTAKPYAKATFLTATGVAAYYGAFPGMYQQAQNIADNASLYVAYSNVENEVLSYLATGADSSGKAQDPSSFVHALDRRMAELNRVAIGFDATKLPSSVGSFSGVEKSVASPD